MSVEDRKKETVVMERQEEEKDIPDYHICRTEDAGQRLLHGDYVK